MRKLTLLCVGRLKEPFYVGAAAEYVKRLSRYCKTEVLELPEARLAEDPSPARIQAALEREAASIRARLPAAARVTALCVEGRALSSEQFAAALLDAPHHAFIIGGSYGLDASIKDAASFRLSMSPMTFPHHLARVMLLEQLYRACQIQTGGRYHK